jgi:hypothetical protein
MRPLRGLLLGVLTVVGLAAAEPAPYVDSAAIRERFASITAADMELLRSKRILLASRSFGLNLYKGLGALAKADARYDLLGSYQRFDVAKAGGDLSIIPPDVFTKSRFVHFLATYWPHTKRVEEMDHLLRDAPHRFGKTVDAVVIFYHTAIPAAFPTYSSGMDALHRDFPNVRFIYVTPGFMGPARAADNENSFAFGELARARYRGREPLYDLGKILSDDFRAGHAFCPEYSQDPAGVHPDLPAGEAMMAKGFLLVLRDAFKRDPAPTVDTSATATTGAPPAPIPARSTEHIAADHPDAKAVRALLDANDLKQKQVDAISVVRGGRIVGLYLQEAGVREITADIGQLTALEVLHVYADRSLPLPRLQRIAPELGKCRKLTDLLLTGNDLGQLPDALSQLTALRTLSVADNQIAAPSPGITAWLQRFDPTGLARQRAQ